MARVKIDVTGDGSGFHKVMSGVEHRIHGLKEKVGFSFGETFAALAGGATIVAMVDNMANFAKEINNASSNLGVATDRIQQLRTIARHAGKDLDVFQGIFTKSEAFASKALVPGSKEANTAARLGITQADLTGANSLSKDDLLKKMLTGTNGMSRNAAEQLLSGAVGKKNAGFLVANKEEITSGKGLPGVADEDLAKMAELKESWEDLIDVVRARLIPVFNNLVEWAQRFTAKASDALVLQGKMGDAKEEFAAKNGTRAGFWKSAGIEAATGFLNFGAIVYHPFAKLFGSDETLGHRYDQVLDWHDKLKYGKGVNDSPEVAKAAQKGLEQVVATREELERASAARRNKRKEEQEAMKHGGDREAPVTKTSNKLVLSNGSGGGDAQVKIGNLMGVDSTYRLERIGVETNDILKKILAKIGPADGEQPDLPDEMD